MPAETRKLIQRSPDQVSVTVGSDNRPYGIYHLNLLASMARLLNSTSKLEQKLMLILKEILNVLDSGYAILYWYNVQKNEIWPHYIKNGQLMKTRQPAKGGIPEYVIKTGNIVNAGDVENDPRLLKKNNHRYTTCLKSFLAVPVIDNDQNIRGCLQVVNKNKGLFDETDRQYLIIMTDFISLAIQNSKSNCEAREGRRLEHEIRSAVKIQKQLLPDKVPHIQGYDVFAFNRPFHHIGGDYYDFFPFAGGISLTVADVMGKGVPAALVTANLHAFLHANVKECDSCIEIVRKVNTHLNTYTASNMYSTFFWGHLDYDSHRLKYINAGHLPPLQIKANGSSTQLESGGIPVGLVDAFNYKESEVIVDEGDTIIFYSDGLTEVKDANNEQFHRRRLCQIASSNAHLSPKELGDLVLEQIKDFIRSPDRLTDDMTLMILKRKSA